ncbi:hypothetical protein [Thiohalorhabdus methylotrophus]|uniref:DUF2931 family protein n=1 Tax=Thiohalorhabdus methylotrophus TaxID=3242694 RepID=A0ABV4TRV8_9GAMM
MFEGVIRALLPGLCLLLVGCAATGVRPPPEPGNASRAVFLLDHGRHASLVLSTPTGDLIRYAYGDWRYYAERDTGIGSGLAALFSNTPAALGRRKLPGPPEPGVVCLRVRVPVEALYPIRVAGDEVDALRRRLDGMHAEPDRRLYVRAYDLVFVPYPGPYRLPITSNGKVAQWLRALDVEVEGDPLWSDWALEGPQAAGPYRCPR